MVASGFAIALATTGLLAFLGLLQGPSLLPFGGLLLESLLAAGVGGAAGLAAALRGPAAPTQPHSTHSSGSGSAP